MTDTRFDKLHELSTADLQELYERCNSQRQLLLNEMRSRTSDKLVDEIIFHAQLYCNKRLTAEQCTDQIIKLLQKYGKMC